jgi:predicted secreted protein
VSKKIPDAQSVWKEYDKGLKYNAQLGLEETVKLNENFFIGNQWEGVTSNGLPTPQYNFLKRVVLFTVAGITSDNLRMQATPVGNCLNAANVGNVAQVINNEFASLFEQNKIVNLLRVYMRNAAVDGSACLFSYWDDSVENGQKTKGGIVTEIIENTRVFFGNVNDRRVQRQPHIIISSREMTDELKERAKSEGCPNWEEITTDTDERNVNSDYVMDDKTTVLLKLWKNKDTGTVWCIETTRNAVIRKHWDTGLTLYPVTWLTWDYIQDCYHGQAMITGLIPNQIFINKLFALSQISLMTTAFPKIVYDKTRIAKWDNSVGTAVGVNGGDVSNVARSIDPAPISPQIEQFIRMAIEYTQTFQGATSVALGDTRPDNTSAIIALQRAAATPHEIIKQNLYESLEDLGRIYLDFMGGYYGTRMIDMPVSELMSALPPEMQEVVAFAGTSPTQKVPMIFNFDQLKEMHFSLKLDVGAAAYWSEIASMQTLDNLLMQNKIDLVDYLERVPNGYISKQQELIEKIKNAQTGMTQPMPPTGGVEGNGGSAGQVTAPGSPLPIPIGRGYSQLQRKINQTGETA